MLKVLGFARYQVAAVVSWQSTAVALVGIVAGVPLGIAAGRVAWRVFATNFGVVPLTTVNVLLAAALAVGVPAAANVLAFSPRCWPRDHARPSCCELSEDIRISPARASTMLVCLHRLCRGAPTAGERGEPAFAVAAWPARAGRDGCG